MTDKWRECDPSAAWRVIDEMSFMQLQTIKLLVQGVSRDEIAAHIGGRWSRAASANLSQFANRRALGSLVRLGYLYRDWELHQSAELMGPEMADGEFRQVEGAQTHE